MIPNELRKRHQWVTWKLERRKGKLTKVPYNPRTGAKASTTDPKTWTDYETAQATLGAGNYSGSGFVLAPDDPFLFIDLDNCRDAKTGELRPWAQAILDTFNGQAPIYTELSPSGTGLHIVCCGEWPIDRHKQPAPDGGKIEVYTTARFMTVTGQLLDGCPQTIKPAPDGALNWLAATHFPAKPTPKMPTLSPRPDLIPDDTDLLERAMAAKDGPKFAALWRGDTSGYDDDHSRADLAFCAKLAFWTGDDSNRIDRLFRQSGLYRDKWERADYRERTINEVLGGETYQGSSAGMTFTPEPAPDQPDELAAIRAELNQLRAEVAQLRAERSSIMAVIRNPNLRGGEIRTALAATFEIGSAMSRGDDLDGEVTIHRARLAEASGLSEQAVSSNLKRLAGFGVLERRVRRAPAETRVNQETGEIRDGYVSELRVKLKDAPAATLRTLATLDPERPSTWGGRRLACPQHPDADLIIHRIVSCSVCGGVLEETETRRAPVPEPDPIDGLKSQDDISAVQPPPVVIRSIASQDAISDEMPSEREVSALWNSKMTFQPEPAYPRSDVVRPGAGVRSS